MLSTMDEIYARYGRPDTQSGGSFNNLKTVEDIQAYYAPGGPGDRPWVPPAPPAQKTSVIGSYIEGQNATANQAAQAKPWYSPQQFQPQPTGQYEEPRSLFNKVAYGTGKAIVSPVVGFGSALKNMFRMAPIDASKPVGPGNQRMRTTSEFIGDTLHLGTAASNLIPPILAFNAVMGGAGEIPGLKKPVGIINTGFESLSKPGAYMLGTTALNLLPISQQSKDTLRQPLEEAGGMFSTLLFGGAIAHGTGVGVGKIGEKFNEPIARQTLIQKSLTDYNKNLQQTVKDYQKKGIEITPQIAESINNKTLKETPLPSQPATMQIPAPEGDVPLYTEQPVLLQNLLQGRESFDYKISNSLGNDANGKPITAKYDFNYDTKKSTITTTDKNISSTLAIQLGHYIKPETIIKVKSGMSDVIPDYTKKPELYNGGLASYAVDRLNGNATIKQINAKIDSLAEKFKSEMGNLSSGRTPQERYKKAVEAVIYNPIQAAEVAPEFTSFIRHNLDKPGALATAIQSSAIRSGVSPTLMDYAEKSIAQEKALQNQPKMLSAGKEQLQLPAGTENIEITKVKGVGSDLQPLAQEAIKYDNFDNYKKAVEENQTLSPEAQAAVDNLPRGKAQTEKVLKKIYDHAQKEVEAAKTAKIDIISSVDKRGNTVEKTKDGNVVKITDKNGEILYEAEKPSQAIRKSAKSNTTGKYPTTAKTTREVQKIVSETKTSGMKGKGGKIGSVERASGVTKAAHDISQALVDKGYEALKPEEQAKYQEGSYKKDYKTSLELIASNREMAYKMATGETPMLEEIHYPQILYNEVKKLATKENNFDLQIELAKSPYATERSEAAGTLGSAGYNNSTYDPVDIASDVIKAREKNRMKNKEYVKELKLIKRRSMSKPAKEINNKSIITISKLEKFIQDIPLC